MAGESVTLSWSAMAGHVQALSARIERDVPPQVIVGVLRGGMVPAVMLGHRLGVRDLRALEVTCTLDDGVQAAKTPEPVVRNPRSLGDLSGRDVLVVDDVAGSGRTAALARHLVTSAGAARVRTAVTVVNQLNWPGPHPPEQVLDYIAMTTLGWVVFPWEVRA